MMKRLVLLLAIMVGVHCSTFAQQVSDEQVRKEINEAAAKMKTMKCDFVQTKSIKILNDKMVSKGKMYYQQGNKLHWEYISPYTYTFILNDSKVVIRNNKRSDVIDVNQNKMFREIVKIMMNSVVGKCLSDDKDFQVSLKSSATEYEATMIPLRKDLKQMFQKIILHYDRKQKMVSQVELLEKNGDKTLIELKNVQTNVAISADLFAIY